MDPVLVKSDIEKLISNNSKRITFHKKLKSQSSKSDVWNTFEQVLVDNKHTDVVRCVSCKKCLTYRLKDGTTALSRHQNSACSAAPKSSKSSSNNQTTLNFGLKNVPSGAVAALNEDVVIGLAQDLRPLNSVGSRGFLKIAKSLIHFGAMYGDQDPKSILKHRTTLKREFLHKLVDAKRNDISMLVGAAPQFPFFAFTSDMWSDKYRQRSFLSLSIHYINNNWKLTSHMLGVDEFTEDHKTTINIRQQCRQILSKFFGNNVDDVMTNSWIVTDSGSHANSYTSS